MKAENTHTDEIRKLFAEMQSEDDLLALINKTLESLYEKPRKVQMRSLHYYADHRKAKERYKQFAIKKKSGADRTIHAPVKGLKTIQRALNDILQEVYTVHPAATGFVPGKSIVDNARLHINQPFVYNIDLKDFFPSIGLRRVKACLELDPFNLTGEQREPLAYLIANLCCHPLEVEVQEEGEWVKKTLPVLPQGAPTSPTITNIVSQRLDFLLSGLAKRFRMRYSRYADDITFSSYTNEFKQGSVFIKS